MTYDELRLQQLLGPFNRPQGIATLNPLAFQYTDQLYPDLQSTDVGYSIAPPGSADEGYAIGPYGTADDLISTGFYGSPDIGFPFAPANRLGGLDLPRFQGVSKLGRQDEDVEQKESLVEEEPSGIEKLFNRVRDIYGTGRDLIGQGISSASSFLTGNPIVGGLMSLISRMKTPMSEYQMRDLQRRNFGPQLQSIYGPGGIMQGYNPVSMFGRGPLESIINRRNKILARKEADKAYSASNLNKLNKAITDLGGSTDRNLSAYRASRPASERRSTGFGKSGMGRDPDRFK
jgi:hypothetical protein